MRDCGAHMTILVVAMAALIQQCKQLKDEENIAIHGTQQVFTFSSHSEPRSCALYIQCVNVQNNFI